MLNTLRKAKDIIKRYKKTSILLTLLVAGAVIFISMRDSQDNSSDFATAQIGTIIQEVSATGRVKAAQSVDLSFDRGGRITNLPVKNGSPVVVGQILAQIESAELIAQRQGYLANILASEQRLEQIIATKKNTKPSNSETALQLSKSLKVAIDAMTDYTDIQYAYFDSYTGEANEIANTKEQILKTIYGQTKLGRVGSWYFLPLVTGLKGEVGSIESSNLVNYDSLITRVKEALTQTKNGLELLNAKLSGTAGATEGDKSLINTNISLIISEQASLNIEDKNLTNEDFEIKIAQSQIDQAKANLALIDAQISKNTLRAPFSGIVTNVYIEKGEIATGGPILSMISSGKYEIEVNVSEAEIARVKLGNTAVISLDAYDSDEKFQARVSKIDPSATIENGVATYRVVLQFENQDERILPGLTADIDIQTNKKENILFVPSRDIISKDDNKFVEISIDAEKDQAQFANFKLVSETKEEIRYEIEVEVGLRGSDGRIEIISGLKEGDKIVSQ